MSADTISIILFESILILQLSKEIEFVTKILNLMYIFLKSLAVKIRLKQLNGKTIISPSCQVCLLAKTYSSSYKELYRVKCVLSYDNGEQWLSLCVRERKIL